MKRRIDAEDNPDDRLSREEQMLVRQEPVDKGNSPTLLTHEGTAIESGMSITDELVQDCQDNWDIADCFDELGNFTEVTQWSQDIGIGQDQGQFNHDESVLALNSENNHLQSDVAPAIQDQAQNQTGRASADQNVVIRAQVSPQSPLHRRTASSSRAFSRNNRGGCASDCARERHDLDLQHEMSIPQRRARNYPSLEKPFFEDLNHPERTTRPGSKFQCSDGHEDRNPSSHRARTWSNSSCKEHPSLSTYQEKLTMRANNLFSDLSQLYKFGVDLDMIQYDERFVHDLSTIKERFKKLSHSGRMDIDQGSDEY
ncbi:hypothetical protein FBEOM_165 [Fusarium beomiforme]|uniref:Uncharacterized protein n=1 Tax=Fusarium beomiforme TaxID=44412 RepID=A0A9P5AW56_9HYPO|nr:hypothetical protein FBEOM_165 [Fusarium beomiforme]